MTMKFATFNTNSIRARLPIIKDWLDREGPDVLCVQETKVQDKDFPADPFEEAGYHVIFKGQKSYNGVAIISKLPPDDILLNLYDKEDEQARFISARIGDIPVIREKGTRQIILVLKVRRKFCQVFTDIRIRTWEFVNT